MIKNQKDRLCKNCDHYDKKKQFCSLFHRKLSPDSYCVVDGEEVFFLHKDD
jgi:hypothetical protein